jgi:murein L,D-transpeptidase YcbB/YkuD
MAKLKATSIFIFGFLLTVFPSHADVSETQSHSTFSFLGSNTPFQDALNDLANTLPYVISFYQKMENEPVWFFEGHLTPYGKIALETLQNADQEGLQLGDYEDAARLPERPENWVDAEILLTKRFLEFIGHLRVGRIDPMKMSPDIKFHSAKTNPVDVLVEALQDKTTAGQKLRHMAPNLPQYSDLKKILADYRSQTERIKGWPELTGGKALKLGDRDAEVNTLRQILVQHGDLPEGQEVGENFDAAVDTALRQFQKRYSLEPDGVVGDKTKEVLNYPVQERIKQVIVNMERLRWLPNDLGDKHIIVNVAGYVLHGFENSKPTLMMSVIVGRPDRCTPLFYATLKNIVLNPSWEVPHSIFIHDKLPRIIRDPGYVQRSNFTIIDHRGRIIDPDAADWANEGKNYYLRQSPGRHNALGQIKFNIENPYTIYLHGTPDQHLFAKKARAFSSGCIRLKHPLKLAVWALNNDPQWSLMALEAAINEGKTQTINPVEYIPVYFTYQTIWVKDSKKGKRIFFSNDPYKLDAKMIKILNLDQPRL